MEAHGSRKPRWFALRDFRDAPAAITPWSAMHCASGVVAHAVAVHFHVPLWIAFCAWFAAHLLYETKDQLTTRVDPRTGRIGNSLINSIADQTVGMAGFLLAAAILGPKNTYITAIVTLATVILILAVVGGPGVTLHVWTERG